MYQNITTGVHPGGPGACTAIYNGHTLYNHHNNPSLHSHHYSNHNNNYYFTNSFPSMMYPVSPYSQFYFNR